MLKKYRNFGKPELTIIEFQKLLENYDIDLNVFFSEFIKYVSNNIITDKQISFVYPSKINYFNLSPKQRLFEFTKQYPELLKEIPDFFLILRTCKYKNEFILNDNYEFITYKLQKTILSFIDFIPHLEKHKPDLIIALFKPKYGRDKISKAMTSRISIKKIEDFKAFLKKEQNKINMNRLK
ncbi:MAG: hypothetical protein K5829_10505 [Treponema sp.]|nr:hypothetical protein [Treponema sp.]